MSIPDFHIEIVSDKASFRTLQREWNELFGRSEETLFSQSFDWQWCSLQQLPEPEQQQLRCVIVRASGRMVLIWPFVIAKDKLFWRIASPLGTHATEYSDVLVETGWERSGVIAMALQALLDRCDLVKLHRVRADSPLYGELLRRAEKRGDASLIQTYGAPCVSWDGIGEWEDYERSRSKDVLRDLRRRERRLAECGTIVFDCVTEGPDYQRTLDWLLSTKRQWAQRTKVQAPHLYANAYRAFLQQIPEYRSPSGQARIFVLHLDDKIVAASWDTVTRSSFESFISTYDPEFRKYAPGRILLHYILRWAFQKRVGYDFRIGDEDYKFVWANRECGIADFEPTGTTHGGTHRRIRSWVRRIEASRLAVAEEKKPQKPPGRG